MNCNFQFKVTRQNFLCFYYFNICSMLAKGSNFIYRTTELAIIYRYAAIFFCLSGRMIAFYLHKFSMSLHKNLSPWVEAELPGTEFLRQG